MTPAIKIPSVDVEAALKAGRPLIDLRSPGEFAEDHLPGAVNIPLLDDAQRHVVGFLYKQRSPEAAYDEARRFVAENVPGMLEALDPLLGRPVDRVDPGPAVAVHPGDLTPVPATGVLKAVAYCWRGGFRSRVSCHLLGELGYEGVALLEGGYRSWRRRVVARLEAERPGPLLVLRGMTGTGKTDLLRRVEKDRPGSTLDLEGLARHRSSILGAVGLEPRTQKAFDTHLVERLERIAGASPVLVEGESRKVGSVILPAGVFEAVETGEEVRLVCTMARRVRLLTDEYMDTAEKRAELRPHLPFIEGRLGHRWAGALVGLLDDGRFEDLVEALLEHYYDPLYLQTEKRRTQRLGAAAEPMSEVDAEDLAAAAIEVSGLL